MVRRLALLVLAATVAACTLGRRPAYCTRDADCLNGRQCVKNSCGERSAPPSPPPPAPAPSAPSVAGTTTHALTPAAGRSSSKSFTARTVLSPGHASPVRSSPRYRMIGGLLRPPVSQP
jgi:hypothetical protein